MTKKGIGIAEIAALVFSFGMLVGLYVLPWVSVSFADLIRLVSHSSLYAVNLERLLGFELFHIYSLTASDVLARGQDNLLLSVLMLAAALALILTLWAVLEDRARRIAGFTILLAGLAGLAYFVMNFGDLTGRVGLGFLMTAIATVGLVLQAGIPRALMIPIGTQASSEVDEEGGNIRLAVFAGIFVIGGLIVLAMTPYSINLTLTSTLTFDGGIGAFSVNTVDYAIFIAVFFYILGGIIGLLPIYHQRFNQFKYSWLLINAILVVPSLLVLATAGKSTNLVTMLASSVRLAVPIIIGAMAGIWCERSGVVNIAIEGMMLTGACFGFVTYTFVAESVPGQNGLYIGVLVSVLSGGVMALLHGVLSITFKTDQIVSGTVINILALGLTSFMRREVLLSSDATRETLRAYTLPVLSDIPIIGEVFFSGKPIFFSMFILIGLTHVMLYFTRWGLRTRAVGENPHAADTLGISVIRNRYINVFIGGLIAGFAGAWFSLETTGTFDNNMTNGLGFIALAAVIFGKWRPLYATVGGLLFGFASALDTRFQILEVGVPPQFIQMTPYIVTIIVLAGLVGKAIAPKAVGQPYEKE